MRRSFEKFATTQAVAGRSTGGAERLSFGPNRSADRTEVVRRLDAIFERTQRELRRLRDHEDAVNYESEAIRLAAVVHADLIGVHPFEDGNGRSCRAFMSYLLVSVGLLPIPVEACKDEYNQMLNGYFETEDSSTMLDFFLRLYPEGPT